MESTYEIPLDINKEEDTYELPMKLNNVEETYDTLMNMNVDAEIHLDTKQTGYMKKRTVAIIFLILIIIFVGVCVGVYFAGKTTEECKDEVNVLQNVFVTATVSKVTPGSRSTEVINGKCIILLTIKLSTLVSL